MPRLSQLYHIIAKFKTGLIAKQLRVVDVRFFKVFVAAYIISCQGAGG